MAARIGALAGGGEIPVSGDSLDGGTASAPPSRAWRRSRGFNEPIELVSVDRR